MQAFIGLTLTVIRMPQQPGFPAMGTGQTNAFVIPSPWFDLT